MKLPVVANDDFAFSVLSWALRNGTEAFASFTREADEYIARFDTVFAVWAISGSVHCVPMKGKENISSGKEYTVGAVPCSSREEAIQLAERYGDPAWFDEPPPPRNVGRPRLAWSADA